jgi:tRNA threonylcarbamoyladenosine biosynthesis protein TsaE
MVDYSFTSTDAASTATLGSRLGHLLEKGDVVLLRGDLGAGKTTFARGLIQGLIGAETEIVSPTFTLVQTYDTAKGTIYHYDLYRLKQDEHGALTELGWDDGLIDGITLVEWPERLEDVMPQDSLIIDIRQDAPDQRVVTMNSNGVWHKRLEALRS